MECEVKNGPRNVGGGYSVKDGMQSKDKALWKRKGKTKLLHSELG
jgi:hypothetical protein